MILAHANNKLNEEFNSSIQYGPEDCYLKNELNSATTYCNAWFTDNRKKALLANIGIGTIDQALQSILPNRHQSLRLIGLFRKVLIVDEVHACDDYMLKLLETLITFHAASGGSIILLSATLPQKMRQTLTNAFYASQTNQQHNLPKDNSYPLATYCRIDAVPEVKPVEPINELSREVNVQVCDDKTAIAKIILAKLNAGLCVCWIRNTVQDAIVTYQQFSSMYVADKITLFHARFTMNDRYQLEDKVNNIFGKENDNTPKQEQRRGQLLIATQVVEQSLDLDFDFMVTDLAPIDLIIQRMGRLQRHQRNEKRPAAILLVHSPIPDDKVEENWYSALLPRAARVYKNHAQLWLTAKLLQEHPIIKIPADVREFIEYVYDENYQEQAPEALQKRAEYVDGKARGNRETAKMIALQLNDGYQILNNINWWEDIYAPTRLSEQKTIQVYLAIWDSVALKPWYSLEKFAWEMSTVNTPEYYFPKDNTLIKQHPILDDKFIKEMKKNYYAIIYNTEQKNWFYLKREEEQLCLYKLNDVIYSNDCGLMRQAE